MTVLCITCKKAIEINPNEIYIENGNYFYKCNCGRKLPFIKINGFFEPIGYGKHEE